MEAYLERIAPVCLSIYHLHNIFMNRLSCLISITPVVCGSNTILANKEIFGIVDILVRASLNSVDNLLTPDISKIHAFPHTSIFNERQSTYTWLQINQYRSRDIPCIVRLVEEYILSVTTFSRKVLKVAILTYAMFLTQLLPKLTANLRSVRVRVCR